MRKIILSISLLSALGFASCSDDDKKTADDDQQLKSEIVENYAAIVYASYQDAYTTAVALQGKVNAFVATPTEATLNAAKTAWLAAREPYGQTEAYRFYGGPIEEEWGDGQINSWPLDEAFIDYVADDAASGIINDTETEITAAYLQSVNQADAEENVATGYHAIEFLLWGQDLTAPSEKKPGQRSYTDYLTKSNADRRIIYLKTVTDLLVEGLGQLVDAWKPGAAYRTDFTKNVDASLADIINGAGRLAKGELAGERMTVALDEHDQEQEHSCFSDNTHRDIANNLKGVENVYTGKYTRVDGSVVSGKSLADWIKTKNATLSSDMLDKLETATAAANDSDLKPFDNAISGSNATGNAKVQSAITAIKAVADGLIQVASELKVAGVAIHETND